MKVLVFGAHPDDAEICCGGTIAKYRKGGHEVSIIHACNGNKGDYITPPDQLAQIRCREAVMAGNVVGAKVYCLGYGDAEVFYNEETLGVFVDAIRKEQPDVIFTHNPEDYHLDHTAVSKLVVDGTFLSTVPSYRPQSQAINTMPQIYFMETYTGIRFQPSEYVDISQEMDLKLKMMECHPSQLKWVKEHDNLDLLDFLQVSGKYRGYQCGTVYAECFRRYLTALRAVPGNFLP